MSISGIGMSDHSTSWGKRKTQKNLPGTNFALHMTGADTATANNQVSDITRGNGIIAGMASRRDTYVSEASDIRTAGVYSKDSISATQELNLPIETERYKIEDASFLEGVAAYSITDKETELLNHHVQRIMPRNETNTPSGGQDTKTSSEIIVKPDGSRVLMITVEIGGMQTAMSLQISEPTDMQNDITKQEIESSKASVSTALLQTEQS